MSNEALQRFRSLITERFTAVAVEIFGEVQSLVEAYDDENKRLRTLLNSVLSPEIRLPRIDVSRFTVKVLQESPPDLQTREESETLEQQHEDLKEEQIECVIGEELQDLEPPNIVVQVKNELDEDLPSITETYNVVEMNDASSIPLSGVEDSQESENNSDEELHKDTENEEQCTIVSKKKGPQQKTMLEMPRFKRPFKDLVLTPSDYKSFIGRLSEAYKDMPDNEKPLIAMLGLTEDVEFVDCAFGKVPKGSPLSYQYPVPSDQDFTTIDDAPPQPRLPLQSQKIEPVFSLPTLSAREQEHINRIHLSWEGAYTLEHSSRGNKELIEQVRDVRLTNPFRDIFLLKTGRSNAEHLIVKIKKGKRGSKSAQIEEELKAEALREYCRLLCVNWYPCGWVVHPEAPWLAALPHGLVYDQKETISFGLVHIKCPSFRSFTECKFLVCKKEGLQLRKDNTCYWQVQGEMMVTGTAWCDLLVLSGEDMLVQRIYRDEVIMQAMKKKLDEFFFYYYLPSLYQ